MASGILLARRFAVPAESVGRRHQLSVDLEGFLYLAVMLDLFTRRVVGWAMETHREELVLNALNMALAQRRRTEDASPFRPWPARVDSNGRRNITFRLIEDTGLRLPPGFSIQGLCVALN